MNKTTKTLSLAVAMFAITGMTGAFSNQAFAGNGGEGCSPGHWKNDASKRGEADWSATALDPSDDWDTFFTDVTLRVKGVGPTNIVDLEDALNAKGGKINALAREAVAALLNESHPTIDYPMDQAAIIALVNAAIAGDNTDIENARAELRALNHNGDYDICPLPVI